MLRSITGVCAVMMMALHSASPQSTGPAASGATVESWQAINEQGDRLRQQGRCREAAAVFLRARSAAMKELGRGHAGTANPTNNLAAAYLCLGELTQAERHFRAALALLDTEGSSGMKAGVLNNLGVLLMHQTRMGEAEEVFRQCLILNEALHGASHPSTAVAISSLGVLRLHAGEYTQARDLFRRALAIWEASLGDHLDTATALNNLGAVSLYLREYEQGREFTARALEMRRHLLPPGHPDIAQSLYNHAVALDRLGQRKSARGAFREAASIKSAFASENFIGVTVDVRALDRR